MDQRPEDKALHNKNVQALSVQVPFGPESGRETARRAHLPETNPGNVQFQQAKPGDNLHAHHAKPREAGGMDRGGALDNPAAPEPDRLRRGDEKLPQLRQHPPGDLREGEGPADDRQPARPAPDPPKQADKGARRRDAPKPRLLPVPFPP